MAGTGYVVFGALIYLALFSRAHAYGDRWSFWALLIGACCAWLSYAVQYDWQIASGQPEMPPGIKLVVFALVILSLIAPIIVAFTLIGAGR